MTLIAQSSLTDFLAYTSNENKLGYINLKGQEIIPVEFDDIKSFSEGLIAVNKGAKKVEYEKVGGKWGYYNLKGEQVIPLKYDYAESFKEGLAPVRLNGTFGYINKQDKLIIPFQYQDAQSFSEELSGVKLNGKWGFIDKSGSMIIPPNFDDVRPFNNGLSIVFRKTLEYEYEDDGYTYTEIEGKYGLINKKGELLLETIYDYIGDFKNGFAKIELERKQGFIDLNGEISIPIIYDKVEDFSEGYAVVANYMLRNSYHNFGYTQKQTDSLKKEVEVLQSKIEPTDFNTLLNHPTYREYQRAKMQEPSEELLHGYIDTQGNLKIDFQFDQAEEFKNGLAQIRFGEQSFITMIRTDEKGNKLPSYREKVGMGDNLINKEGKLILEKNYEIINRYNDSIFVLYDFKGAGAMKESQITLIKNQYQNLSYLGNGYFLAQLNNSKIRIVIDKNNKELFEWESKRIDYSGFDLFVVAIKSEKKTRSKKGIVNIKGKWILEPKYDYIAEFRKIE